MRPTVRGLGFRPSSRIPALLGALLVAVVAFSLFTPASAQQKYKEVKAENFDPIFAVDFVSPGITTSDVGRQNHLRIFFVRPYPKNVRLGFGFGLLDLLWLKLPGYTDRDFLILGLPVSIEANLMSGRRHMLDVGLLWTLLTEWSEEAPWGGGLGAPDAMNLFARLEIPLWASGDHTGFPTAMEVGYSHYFSEIEYEDSMGSARTFDPSGLYARLSCSLGGMEWDTSWRSKKVQLPNPKLSLLVSFDAEGAALVEGEGGQLTVVVSNNGKGLAEDLKIRCTATGEGAESLLLPKDLVIGDLDPRDQREAKLDVRTKADLTSAEEARILVECIEKDGFRAEDVIAVKVHPKIVREEFPPVLDVQATLREPNGNDLLDALEEGSIEVSIENRGRGNAWNLLAEISLDGAGVEEHITLGTMPAIRRLKPGESKVISIPIAAGWDLGNGEVEFNLTLKEGNGFDAAPLKMKFAIQKFLEPRLAVVKSGVDDSEGEHTFGDGDNIIENMETVEVTVLVQNQGQGVARAVTAMIESKDPNVLYYGLGEYSLGDIEPGAIEPIMFRLLVNNRYDGPAVLPLFIELEEHCGRYGVERRALGLELDKVSLAAREFEIAGRRHKEVEPPRGWCFCLRRG